MQKEERKNFGHNFYPCQEANCDKMVLQNRDSLLHKAYEYILQDAATKQVISSTQGNQLSW